MKKAIYGVASLAIATALVAAGCGSSSNTGGAYGGESESSSVTEKSPPGAESGVAVLTVASAPKVGPVLVEAKGFTVYDFHKDKSTTSTCYGACAQAWPPVLSEGPPTAGEGATSAKLGTTKREDGTMQVTYAGHPLYTYAGDTKPGEANGNALSQFGARWYALKGSGEETGR